MYFDTEIIQIDDKEPDTNSLLIRPVYRSGLPTKESYKNTELVDKYKIVIHDVLTRLLETAGHQGPIFLNWRSQNSDLLVPNELIESLVDFETKLAEAIPPVREWFDVEKYYNMFSLEAAELRMPYISLKELIINQTSGFLPQKVILTAPSYLDILSKVLRGTDERTVQAYFVWSAVRTHAMNIRHEAVQPLFEFENYLQGKARISSEERWKVCVRHVNGGLGKQRTAILRILD